jgi:hypothetical protein
MVRTKSAQAELGLAGHPAQHLVQQLQPPPTATSSPALLEISQGKELWLSWDPLRESESAR